MEYEIEDELVMFDSSTNPSLIRRGRRRLLRPSRRAGWKDEKPCQIGVRIPEEEEYLS